MEQKYVMISTGFVLLFLKTYFNCETKTTPKITIYNVTLANQERYSGKVASGPPQITSHLGGEGVLQVVTRCDKGEGVGITNV